MANQELYQAILDRRSVRKYLDKPLSVETIQELIVAGMYAPSARNEQPWRFLVITDRDKLKTLHGDNPAWAMLDHAAAAIVIVADMSLLASHFRDYFLEDCGACAQNILLAAHAMDLGAVWLGTHPIPKREAQACKVLGIPEDGSMVPFCIISLGHPAETPPRPKRWDPSRVKWDLW